jgi:hypothetical protein
MIWQDIVDLIENGTINALDEVKVYDGMTGDEFEADLIEFDEDLTIQIIINPDPEVHQ